MDFSLYDEDEGKNTYKNTLFDGKAAWTVLDSRLLP